MYTEDQFIQLSALQHYVFCPRQCALIHVDDVWNDNVFTVRGNILHEKVDTDAYETRGALKTVRALKIHSFRLGISGQCDVVEFRKRTPNHSELVSESTSRDAGVSLNRSRNKFGLTRERGHSELVSESDAGQTLKQVQGDTCVEVLPVEFKAGQPKQNISDEVQLCAQALCLEEMLARTTWSSGMNTPVKRGAFFYGRIRRRVQVEIGEQLRKQTEEIIAAVHDIVGRKVVPQAAYSQKCRTCSLEHICQPKAMNERKLKTYITGLYEA